MKVARSTALVLLLAAATVWCLQTVRKAERANGNDLVGYLAASRALYDGADPYRLPHRFPYIYPLFLATVIRPLASVPVRYATVLWFALQCGCLLYVLRGSRLRFGVPKITGAAAIAVLAAVFGDVLQIELLNGQVNLVVLCLIVAAMTLSGAAAPLLLGAAIAIKLTPALMLVYWVVERKLVAVAQAILWAAAFILVPWFVVGDRLWPLYREYTQQFLLARTAVVDPSQIAFSVYAMVGKITGSMPSRLTIVASAATVVGAIALWHARTRPRLASTPRWTPPSGRNAAAWVYLAATPLLSPMSEVHHLTAALPLASAAGNHAHRAAIAIPLALFAVLLWIGRLDRHGPWYFLAVVALLVAGIMAVRMNPEQD